MDRNYGRLISLPLGTDRKTQVYRDGGRKKEKKKERVRERERERQIFGGREKRIEKLENNRCVRGRQKKVPRPETVRKYQRQLHKRLTHCVTYLPRRENSIDLMAVVLEVPVVMRQDAFSSNDFVLNTNNCMKLIQYKVELSTNYMNSLSDDLNKFGSLFGIETKEQI